MNGAHRPATSTLSIINAPLLPERPVSLESDNTPAIPIISSVLYS